MNKDFSDDSFSDEFYEKVVSLQDKIVEEVIKLADAYNLERKRVFQCFFNLLIIAISTTSFGNYKTKEQENEP